MLKQHASPNGVENLVDWKQPAEVIGLQERAFWDAVRNQGIPHYRLNARVIRFRMSEIEEWLRARRAGGVR